MGWTYSILENKNHSRGAWFVKLKGRWGSLRYEEVDVKLFKLNIKTKECEIVDCRDLLAPDIMY